MRMLPAEKRMLVRYEDLCRDVKGTLDQVYRFCGVDPEAHAFSPSAPQHIVGNKMRLKGVKSVRLDERWKTELSRDQMDEITQVAGPLGRQYGYGMS